MGRAKFQKFFDLRTLASGFTMAGLLVCLFSSQAPKWWKELQFTRTALFQDGSVWVLKYQAVCSAEGSILFTTQTTRHHFTRPGGLPVRSWHGELLNPGYTSQVVPFPKNLWFESSGWQDRWISTLCISRASTSLRIPWWPFIALFGAWPTARAFAWARAKRYARAGACPACGYDLRGSPNRCPECGRETSADSQLSCIVQ